MEKYIIFDNFENREVFEGTFEDYKNYIVKVYKDTKESLTEEELKSSGLNDSLEMVAHLIEIEVNFIELFNSLEYHNLNVFGDCVDLEVRNEKGKFLYSR